jgi:hypothetical protein
MMGFLFAGRIVGRERLTGNGQAPKNQRPDKRRSVPAFQSIR